MSSHILDTTKFSMGLVEEWVLMATEKIAIELLTFLCHDVKV